jgi:DnaK suppressor protein
MAVMWIEESGDRIMDTDKTRATRQRLSSEYEQLSKSINRNRLAAEQIKVENTEDECDLATINHDKGLLYHLQESDARRLRCIEDAMKALDRGEYGDCVRCGEGINEKRLLAVPWTTMCIRCQEEAEMDRHSSDQVMSGLTEEMEF